MTNTPKQYRKKGVFDVTIDNDGRYIVSDAPNFKFDKRTFERIYEPVEQAAQGWISEIKRLRKTLQDIINMCGHSYNLTETEEILDIAAEALMTYPRSQKTGDMLPVGYSTIPGGITEVDSDGIPLPKPPAREGALLEPSESDIKKHEERLAHILAQAAEPRD